MRIDSIIRYYIDVAIAFAIATSMYLATTKREIHLFHISYLEKYVKISSKNWRIIFVRFLLHKITLMGLKIISVVNSQKEKN